jgi:hypothetical protein
VIASRGPSARGGGAVRGRRRRHPVRGADLHLPVRRPGDFTAFFRRWYGPTLKAFDALSEGGRAELEADLTSLAGRWDRNGDGGSVAIPATYLETVITLR